jgi:hypothetical protein
MKTNDMSGDLKMKHALVLTLLLLISICSKAQYLAAVPKTVQSGGLMLPTRLVQNQNMSLYTHKQVCDDARINHPQKKAIMVVLKTHYCDTGTRVCVKSEALVSDPANALIQDNFAVYDTRFIEMSSMLANTGEEAIRKEWAKKGVNPEFVILDPKTCSEIYRKVIKKGDLSSGILSADVTMRQLDFEANYRALRSYLLSEPRVAALLGGKYNSKDEAQIKAELDEISSRRSTNPQPTFPQIFKALADEDSRLGIFRSSPLPPNYKDAAGTEGSCDMPAKPE